MSSTKKKKILSLKYSIQQKEKKEKTAAPWHIKCKGVPLRLETNSENDFPASSESFLDIVSRNEQKKVQQISKKNSKYLLFG